MINTLKNIWTKSIRRQLIMGIILVHAVLMTIFVLDLVDRQKQFLHEEGIVQALGLASTLAANSSSWVLSNDLIGMDEVIQSQLSFPHLQYAMVLTKEGKVLAHMNRQNIGLFVKDKPSLFSLKQSERHVVVENSYIIDTAAPIKVNNKLIGWARVSITQKVIVDKLDILTVNGVIYTIIAVIVGAIFAFFMARGMTRSLQHLVEVADKVRDGSRDVRAIVTRVDEIGRLGDDFNSTLEHLISSEDELILAKEKLAASEERFDLAVKGSNDGIWDWDIRTNNVYFSTRWKEMLGYANDDIKGTQDEWKQLVHPDDIEAAERDVQRHLNGEVELYENTHRIKQKDGKYRWHHERGICVRDDKGAPYRMVGVNTDVSERKKIEQALFDEKEKALVTLHSIGDAVITTDRVSHIEYMNPVAESLTGWSLSDARDKDIDEILEILNERSGNVIINPVKRCLAEQTVVDISNDSILIAKDGRQIPIADSAAPIRDRENKIIGTVMVFHDVSVNRDLTRKMTWQATHDNLTGLINRSEFEYRLEQLLHVAYADNSTHVLLYLDLDQFKIVNDTCGHAAGDELLKQVSFLLLEEIRKSDTLARLGGDEFGVLLNLCNVEKGIVIANNLRQVVEEFKFVLDEKTFDVGISIGLTTITKDCISMNSVLTEADIACYAAKDQGRNRVHIYTHDDEDISKRHTEMQWVTNINKALDENRFVLYSQAIVSLRENSEHLNYREVLIRMIDENGDIISPHAFIPAAERYGIMPLIDKWVIKNSFKYISENKDKNEKISINLSGNTLSDENVLSFILEKINEYDIDPKNICFEITETIAITHMSRAIVLMRELKAVGCSFSLDDFGSGLSSFAYLKNMPVDYLKIDGSFVKDIVDDEFDYAMVNAINQVGHIMGIKTVAEFVENDEIVAALRKINVDYIQGYGVEKPRPLN